MITRQLSERGASSRQTELIQATASQTPLRKYEPESWSLGFLCPASSRVAVLLQGSSFRWSGWTIGLEGRDADRQMACRTSSVERTLIYTINIARGKLNLSRGVGFDVLPGPRTPSRPSGACVWPPRPPGTSRAARGPPCRRCCCQCPWDYQMHQRSAVARTRAASVQAAAPRGASSMLAAALAGLRAPGVAVDRSGCPTWPARPARCVG